MSEHARIVAESALAVGVIIAVLVAVADTPLYPLAFGAVGIAGLYVLLEYPTALPSWVNWAGARLR